MTKKNARVAVGRGARAEDEATATRTPLAPWIQEAEEKLARAGHDLGSLLDALDALETIAQAEHEASMVVLVPGPPPTLRPGRRDVREGIPARAALVEIAHARALANRGNAAGAQEAARRAGVLVHERALERDARRQEGTRKPRTRPQPVLDLIRDMLHETTGATARELWRRLPAGERPAVVSGYELYRDGDRLVQVDARTGPERAIARKTFINLATRAKKSSR